MNKFFNNEKVVVIGGGSWGVAIASAVASKTGQSLVLTSNKKRAFNISRGRSNRFPDLKLHPGIKAGVDPNKILKDSSITFLVTEVKRSLDYIDFINKHTLPESSIIVASKGFSGNCTLLPDVLKEKTINRSIGILTGPSFAHEVMAKKPTALMVAGNSKIIKLATDVLHSNNLRIYGSSDVIGASISGSMKNVIAIACGFVSGLKLGENARAAIWTRGLSETARLVLALGGKVETVFGLAGAGDMALSCFSGSSRNFSWGYAYALNKNFEDVLVEGINAAKEAHLLAKKLNIDMPITELVAKTSKSRLDLLDEAVKLLERPPTSEWIEK